MPEAHRSESPDLYELLEVSRHAGQDVIQAAYRTLARNHHPDRNTTPDAGKRIRQLNAAYEVLSDPSRRARYDLEYTRAQRREWLVKPEHNSLEQSHTGTPGTSTARARVLPSARTGVRARPAEERFSRVNGQLALLVLVVLGGLTLMLLLVWLGMDPVVDAASYSHPLVELSAR